MPASRPGSAANPVGPTQSTGETAAIEARQTYTIDEFVAALPRILKRAKVIDVLQDEFEAQNYSRDIAYIGKMLRVCATITPEMAETIANKPYDISPLGAKYADCVGVHDISKEAGDVHTNPNPITGRPFTSTFDIVMDIHQPRGTYWRYGYGIYNQLGYLITVQIVPLSPHDFVLQDVAIRARHSNSR
jgi:hypothetical protein